MPQEKKLYSFHPLLAGACTPTEYFLFHPSTCTLGDFFVNRDCQDEHLRLPRFLVIHVIFFYAILFKESQYSDHFTQKITIFFVIHLRVTERIAAKLNTTLRLHLPVGVSPLIDFKTGRAFINLAKSSSWENGCCGKYTRFRDY